MRLKGLNVLRRSAAGLVEVKLEVKTSFGEGGEREMGYEDEWK